MTKYTRSASIDAPGADSYGASSGALALVQRDDPKQIAAVQEVTRKPIAADIKQLLSHLTDEDQVKELTCSRSPSVTWSELY